MKLGEVCSINPPKPVLKDDEEVTFLPMSAISDNGTVINRQIRLYGKVKKGYTGFIENDILFAKITPCMENGKGVIAKDLVTAVGFGSTEFHVVRASQDILPEIIFRYLSLDRIRKYAKNNMVGSAGQKRVPDIFLKSLQLPLPPLPAQHKIVEILEEADNLRKLRQQADEKMKDLIPSLFVQMFGDPATNPKGWKMKKLGDVVDKVSLQIMPTDYPDTEFVYIGLEHIESNTGQLAKINYQSGESIKSSKNKFKKGDILYGKLRPYLNKVWLADRSGICSTDIWVIKPIKDKTTGYFIPTFLRFQQIVKRLNSKTEGANLPRVKTESFNKIPVPLPPLPLQQEFAKLVEKIETEKARQAESRKKLDELFQSLMQRAFTGELVA